jgi:hypothetical protein
VIVSLDPAAAAATRKDHFASGGSSASSGSLQRVTTIAPCATFDAMQLKPDLLKQHLPVLKTQCDSTACDSSHCPVARDCPESIRHRQDGQSLFHSLCNAG